MMLKNLFKRYVLKTNYIPSRFSFMFALVGITGVLLIDRIIHLRYGDVEVIDIGPLTLGILYTLAMTVVIYLLLKYMLSIVKVTEASYHLLEQREKESLRLFNFALDNSADAIYWFTFDGKFYYVNDAASYMLGYKKEELLGMDLWEMDHNFTSDQAQAFLLEIKEVKRATFETTQTKKDGKVIPIEVSANYFAHEGKEFICAFGRDISERRDYQTAIEEANSELKRSISEKEMLLKEVHHRVKNNLEIISSLLSMQYRRIDDSAMRLILQESKSRIHTMSLVHEFLYKSEKLSEIDLDGYVTQLVTDIVSLYTEGQSDIKLCIYVEKLKFSTDASIRLGMILHELCVNTIKYAYNGIDEKRLSINLEQEDEILHLCVEDNGNGVKDIKELYESNSLGVQLIKIICEDQLDGEVNFLSEDGLRCDIYFPYKAVI